MSYCYVAPVDQARRAEWERVFGTDRVPVLDGRPRLAELREGPILVYDVAVAGLHAGQLARVAGCMARRRRIGYEEARTLVRLGGLRVKAEGLVVVPSDVGSSIRRLRFAGVDYATPSRPFVPYT